MCTLIRPIIMLTLWLGNPGGTHEYPWLYDLSFDTLLSGSWTGLNPSRSRTLTHSSCKTSCESFVHLQLPHVFLQCKGHIFKKYTRENRKEMFFLHDILCTRDGDVPRMDVRALKYNIINTQPNYLIISSQSSSCPKTLP